MERKQVYFDMDGVLCNFMKQARLLGCLNDDGSVNLSKVKQNDMSFWVNMEWLPGSKAFLDAALKLCTEHGAEVGILSAVGFKSGVFGKQMWLHENTDFDRGHILIVHNGADKARYASPRRLLIDDMKENVDDFINAGGHAILFNDPAQALVELEEFLCT